MQIREAVFERVKHRLFYGWVILGVATIAMFATGVGQSHTFSIFVDLIAADLGISSTSIASSYAFATLIAALGLSRMGHFVDLYGARKVLIVVTILLGFACFLFGAAAGVIGASIGPLPLAISFDYFGAYDGALHLLALIPLGCAVLALFLPPPDPGRIENLETSQNG